MHKHIASEQSIWPSLQGVNPTRHHIDRFLSKFTKSTSSDCWIWTAGKDGDGYGRIFVNGKSVGAHRLSWVVFHGAIPEGLCVLHNCPSEDNPACVNPEHLWLGTHRDNQLDKLRKWRAKHLAFNRSKISSVDVLTVRRLHGSGQFTYQDLAARFRISPYSIGEIVRRETWAWLH